MTHLWSTRPIKFQTHQISDPFILLDQNLKRTPLVKTKNPKGPSSFEKNRQTVGPRQLVGKDLRNHHALRRLGLDALSVRKVSLQPQKVESLPQESWSSLRMRSHYRKTPGPALCGVSTSKTEVACQQPSSHFARLFAISCLLRS